MTRLRRPGRGSSRSRSSVNCLGAPASRRPGGPKARILVRASREAGGTAALPGAGPPLPTSPLKGGGEKTAAIRPFVQRRRCRRVLAAPSALLPPEGGRRENGGDPLLRPTTTMPESPIRAIFAPPPWKGGGREGGCPRLRRPDGGLPTASAPRPPRPLFSPLEGGPGGMTRRRPPARRCGTPLPTSPLKGGGEKTAAIRPFVQRRRCRRVLAAPSALLPPGRGEVGRGDAPGSADRTGGLPTVSAPRPPRPLFSPLEGGPGGMTRRRPPARRCGTPLPTSPLKGEERNGGRAHAPARRWRCR